MRILSLLNTHESQYAGVAMRILIEAVILLIASSPLAAQPATGFEQGDGVVRALAALERAHPDEALAILQPLAASDPKGKGIAHALGLVYYRTGKLVEAQHAFAAAAEQDPMDKESVQLEGGALSSRPTRSCDSLSGAGTAVDAWGKRGRNVCPGTLLLECTALR